MGHLGLATCWCSPERTSSSLDSPSISTVARRDSINSLLTLSSEILRRPEESRRPQGPYPADYRDQQLREDRQHSDHRCCRGRRQKGHQCRNSPDSSYSRGGFQGHRSRITSSPSAAKEERVLCSSAQICCDADAPWRHWLQRRRLVLSHQR